VIGIGLAGLLIYLILGEPILMALAIVAVIALIVREHRSVRGGGSVDLSVVRDEMQRKAMVGYETKHLEEELDAELDKRSFDSAAQRERARRRALGYPK
jgi:hypothetical protein